MMLRLFCCLRNYFQGDGDEMLSFANGVSSLSRRKVLHHSAVATLLIVVTCERSAMSIASPLSRRLLVTADPDHRLKMPDVPRKDERVADGHIIRLSRLGQRKEFFFSFSEPHLSTL
jgi:hypothetical protein